uniref:Uncharacterized protein n=1 Tax=Arundo donax TaxID=35708 RepID=A0A0A8ZU22_ARUDO
MGPERWQLRIGKKVAALCDGWRLRPALHCTAGEGTTVAAAVAETSDSGVRKEVGEWWATTPRTCQIPQLDSTRPSCPHPFLRLPANRATALGLLGNRSKFWGFCCDSPHRFLAPENEPNRTQRPHRQASNLSHSHHISSRKHEHFVASSKKHMQKRERETHLGERSADDTAGRRSGNTTTSSPPAAVDRLAPRREASKEHQP